MPKAPPSQVEAFSMYRHIACNLHPQVAFPSSQLPPLARHAACTWSMAALINSFLKMQNFNLTNFKLAGQNIKQPKPAKVSKCLSLCFKKSKHTILLSCKIILSKKFCPKLPGTACCSSFNTHPGV